ncbi:fungal-specific transcription factor domain-containing protein [Mariannaea sp. PMI_226]|nr:fungal-specific transcription factor domain-containing protein [Mariannaea sp. PMI_226]
MPRQSVNRGMTFTGCWTCKSRKIRCDERPVSCKNCERRGITCGGYDIRLQWVSDPFADISPSKGKGRRSIKLDEGPEGQYRMDEIDDFLYAIDNSETAVGTQKGPFSIFPVNDGSLSPANAQETLPYEDDYQSLSPLYETQNDMGDNERIGSISGDSLAVLLSDSDVSKDLIPLETDHPWPIAIRGHRPDPVIGLLETDGAQESALSPDFLSSSGDETSTTHHDSSSSSPALSLIRSASSSPNHFHISFALPPQLTTSLFGDADVDSLIHHYGVHMADLLQPISHVHNIYRELYLSTALEGSCTSTPSPNTSKSLAHMALYHSLLSASAYHMWYCNKNRADYQRIGAKNRQQAIHYLQSAVNASTPGADYKLFLVAILSLVTIGIMSGEGDDFAVHLTGATQLRNSRSRWRIMSSSTKQLNDVSAFLALLARTTAFDTSPPPWLGPSQLALQADEGIMQSNNCYEYIYGITPSIAASIQETCILAEILAQFDNQPPQAIPDDLRAACEASGDKLLSWTLESETIVSIPKNDELMLTIFNHHANAWHRAALIYYHRRIQRCDPIDLALDIRDVAKHMHTVEDIKAQSHSNIDGILAPITWPAFVASCEALGDDRKTWRRWWHRVEHYRIANIQKQWDVIQQIWDETDRIQQARSRSEDWIQLFRRLGCHVLPV